MDKSKILDIALALQCIALTVSDDDLEKIRHNLNTIEKRVAELVEENERAEKELNSNANNGH